MIDLNQTITQLVSEGVQVVFQEMRNLSRGESEKPHLNIGYIGDEVEFDIVLRNTLSHPVKNISVAVHPMELVVFDTNPVIINIVTIDAQSETEVVTIKAKIIKNSDDFQNAWAIRDYVMKIMITGEIDLPTILFKDEEMKYIFVRDDE